MAEESGVTLEDHAPENLPAVLGDRGLIERVLINLVDRARPDTPA